MTNSEPRIALGRERFEIPDWPGPNEDVERSVLAVLRDGTWGRYQAEWTERLESRLAEVFRQGLVFLCCSGTIAVELALRGVGIREGDAVVLAAYDFPGNFRAIEAIGARPILLDVKPGGWTLDETRLDATLSFRPRAVLASHLHGNFSASRQIRAWCDQHQLAYVEDACQVPGGLIGGQPAGSFGHAAALSFGGSKLVTSGRGGAVLTNDERILQRVRVQSERGNHAFPMSQLQAASLLPQLDELQAATARRAEAAAALLRNLNSVPIGISITGANDLAAWYKLPFLLPSTLGTTLDELAGALQKLGIPIDLGFRGFSLRSSRRCDIAGDLSNARVAAARTLLLHHTALLLPTMELERLADVIKCEVVTRD